MTDESPRSTLDALRAHLNQAGGPQFAGTAGTYAVKSFIDDLHTEIHREIDAMMAPPPKIDRRAISLLVSNEKTGSVSVVDKFPFSPEGMASAVSIARDIATIYISTVPVIECLGTDTSWHIKGDDLRFMLHLANGDPKQFRAHIAEYLAEREPS